MGLEENAAQPVPAGQSTGRGSTNCQTAVLPWPLLTGNGRGEQALISLCLELKRILKPGSLWGVKVSVCETNGLFLALKLRVSRPALLLRFCAGALSLLDAYPCLLTLSAEGVVLAARYLRFDPSSARKRRPATW